ncbi:MAG TPA: hypothetical protein VEW48_06600 [Thermoanaerobaculia bacterium]|nr:hypothetical protein [Thermoanaerobaculia bacterium]
MERLACFPGMPKLTFLIGSRLERLPGTPLGLEPEGEDDPETESYTVFAGDVSIGRYTVRHCGPYVERNFFCWVSQSSHLPLDAVPQGAFGWGGTHTHDSLRIAGERVWVTLARLGSALGIRPGEARF